MITVFLFLLFNSQNFISFGKMVIRWGVFRKWGKSADAIDFYTSEIKRLSKEVNTRHSFSCIMLILQGHLPICPLMIKVLKYDIL